MIRHADWKADAIGTISGGPKQRLNPHAQFYADYIIDFDQPQENLTDEMQGDPGRAYTSSTVAVEFIRPLADRGTIEGDAASRRTTL